MSDNVLRTRTTGSPALIAAGHGSEKEITPAPRKFLRLRQVIEATGRCRSSIYEAIKAGTFPPPIPIGARAVAWDAEAIATWQLGCLGKQKAANQQYRRPA